MLHDAWGRVTAELKSAGSTSAADGLRLAASAQTAASVGGLRRTDTRYDLLGRTTQISAPERSTEGVAGTSEASASALNDGER